MNLHSLQNNKKGKRRIGRGGKRGTYSGRGQKGQKSRAGHRIRPAARDLILRIPKTKGLGKNKNRRKSVAALTVSLNTLQKIKEQKITPQVLFKLRVLRDPKRKVKIVSTGTITDAKEVSGISVSAG